MKLLIGRCTTVSVLLIVLASQIHAQGVSGIISGTVTDPTKAAISAATVQIINADTGVTAWTDKTNSSGVYRAPELPIGTYIVIVASSGFKTQRVANVHLAVDQTADISVILQLGTAAQTVTVNGSTEGQLATDTSYQQRPNYLNRNVNLRTGQTLNGTAIQYLLPVSAPDFPLAPVGPYFVGSGKART